MDLDPQTLSTEQNYRLLIGAIVPRPIAWVTTLSANGRTNAAPFSAFTFLSTEPPMVGVSIGLKNRAPGNEQGDALKDTARNMLAQREFVVNIADLDHLDALHLSAQEFPAELSEIDVLQIETAACLRVATPRVANAPVAFECRLAQVIPFGARSSLYVGEILNFHVRDGLLVDGKISTVALKPIARLGGPNYASLGEIISKSTP